MQLRSYSNGLSKGVPARFAVLVLAALMCVWSSFAQSGAGTIEGTVQDSSGGALPDAQVHVVNQTTGAIVDTKANSVGFYSVPSLFAGSYTLTFSAAGMKKYQTSLSLLVAQHAVINPTLSVGDVTEQVTVSGNQIQLATYDSGTISSTLDRARIEELPVNGRALLSLTSLTTPGLTQGGQQANGNSQAALEYVQDGAPLTNRNFGGEGNSTLAQLPDPDAIEEVRLETTNSSAQFTTPATGIITSRGGTNHLHGSFFETARNNAFGIAKVRQNPSNYAVPHYVRNEFGASIGGPIVIPKLYDGRDRSFFFFAFERYSLRSNVSELAYVPMTSWRSGDFSNLYNSAGVLQVLYDPATTNPATGQRTAFPNNKIDPSRESPLAKKLLAITPLPTTADNPLISPNINLAGINNNTIPQVNFRLDQLVNENNKVFLRYTQIQQQQASLRNYPSNSPATVAADGFPAGASGLQVIPVSTFSAALGYTHIFSSTFVSESNVSQEWFNQYVVGGGERTLNYNQMLGLPDNFGELGFPSINGGSMPYGGSQYGYGEAQIVTNVDENLTKTLGRHQLIFGGRYRHERLGYSIDQMGDTITFGAVASADLDPKSGANYTPLPNTGNGNADLFLGAASQYVIALSPPYVHYRDQEIDGYVQDNFHVTKSLTINAGLRWEAHPAPHTEDGLTESFDIANKALVLAQPTSYYIQKGYTTQAVITNLTNLGVKFETPAQAGIPQAMFYDYDFNFLPRVGFAYSPFGGRHGTVLRGGFGRYIYPIALRSSIKQAAANVPFAATYTQSYVNASQSPDGLPNYLLRTPQTIVAGQNSTNVVNSGAANSIPVGGFSIATLDPRYKPAVVTQGNATIEQPLKFNSVLRITYLYDHGSGLEQDFYYNNHPSPYVYETVNGVVPPTGTYASVATGPYDQTTYNGGNFVQQKSGYSNDNALQVNLQRLFKNGYGFQIFWVHSRAIRAGGNSSQDARYPASNYLPGVLPGTDAETLNHFQAYFLDNTIPDHQITFNGLVDLPIGRGKMFFGKVNRVVNEIIGGFQLAGTGQVVSQYFQVAAGNYGATNPLKVYRGSHPITDCRSGVCRKEDLWFNGYIAPTAINAAVNGVSGLPSDYAPYEAPINNVPGTANYGNNNVPVTLNNGTTVQVAYSPGPVAANRYSKTFLLGPYNYNADLSLFKVFPITDKANLRINFDAFNAFNIQGSINPNTTDGTQNRLTSYWSGRQLQLTARLTF